MTVPLCYSMFFLDSCNTEAKTIELRTYFSVAFLNFISLAKGVSETFPTTSSSLLQFGRWAGFFHKFRSLKDKQRTLVMLTVCRVLS